MLSLKNFTYSDQNDPFYKRWLIQTIEKLSGQFKLWRLYCEHNKELQTTGASFWDGALRKLKVNVSYNAEALERAPKDGPLVVVANHPFGVLDGLTIGHLVSQIRDDYRVLTNSVLCKSESIEKYVLPVDFTPTEEAWRTNLDSRQKARALLKLGGCLVVFPAGGVSILQNAKDEYAWDNAWQPFVASLIQGNKTDVLPIYFEGQNSRLFHLAGFYSQTLRLSLFFREIAKRIGSTITVKIGAVIPYSDLAEITDREKLCYHLWKKTYQLGGHKNLPKPSPAFRIEKKALEKLSKKKH